MESTLISRHLFAGTATVLACVGLLAMPAAADTAWGASPLEALPGATISVSGDGCVGNDVEVILTAGSTNSFPGVVSKRFTPTGAGTWSTTLDLPSDLAPGTYTLWGQCIVQFNYENKPFTVLDPDATTTTTTMSTTSTTVTEPGSATTVAPGALSQAAASAPRFTG